MPDDSKKPASASEIRGIIGDIDDAVVTSILRTEALPPRYCRPRNGFAAIVGSRTRAGMSRMVR